MIRGKWKECFGGRRSWTECTLCGAEAHVPHISEITEAVMSRMTQEQIESGQAGAEIANAAHRAIHDHISAMLKHDLEKHISYHLDYDTRYFRTFLDLYQHNIGLCLRDLEWPDTDGLPDDGRIRWISPRRSQYGGL